MQPLWVLCKNARLNGDIRLAGLLAESADVQWDIMCFSETRAVDADVILDAGHRLICNRGNLPFAGVAILVHARLVENIHTWTAVSGRLLYVDMNIHGSHYRIVSIYVPHAGYPNSALEECYEDLRKVLVDTDCVGRKVAVGGDFNTQVGSGPRSDLLMQLVAEFGLHICNYQEPWITDDNWTFRSTLGAHRRIDYILASCLIAGSFGKAIDALNLGSDHRAVQECLWLHCSHGRIR